MTQRDLELQFKADTGFYKEKFNTSDYYDWVEQKLIEKLN